MVRPRLTLIPDRPPLYDIDDRSLAEALVRGEPDAPFIAWRRLRPAVDATLRRLVGPTTPTDLDDLRQEVFLRFFRQVRKLRDPDALRSFLYGICLRAVRREMRARWLHRFLHLTATGEPPDVPGASDPSDAREVVRRYYRVLDRVGGLARSLFVARHIEGLPLSEVAALHGMSVSTVQRRLARATRQVTAMVADDPLLAGYVAGLKRGSAS